MLDSRHYASPASRRHRSAPLADGGYASGILWQ
jgi:hypothetical protein